MTRFSIDPPDPNPDTPPELELEPEPDQESLYALEERISALIDDALEARHDRDHREAERLYDQAARLQEELEERQRQELEDSADPHCYGCRGTGRIRGFGLDGRAECPCTQCHDCGGHAYPRVTDEGRPYCQDCRPGGDR